MFATESMVEIVSLLRMKRLGKRLSHKYSTLMNGLGFYKWN